MTGLYTARRTYYLQRILRPFPIHQSIDWKKIHAIVFESDDWGFCGEGKNRKTNERLSSLGYDLENFELQDSFNNTLENSEDLQGLYSVLLNHKDILGRSPVFTANFVVSNPDFRRIRESGFSKYFAIPIYAGFPDTWNSRKLLQQMWQLGIDKKVWIPEFHGYSHFNYRNWLAGLRRGDKKLRDFFEEEMITSSDQHPTVSEYVIDPSRGEFVDFAEQFSIMSLGCEIFRSTFGRSPMSTIPPHDLWDINTEKAFLKANLRFIQSERTRFSSALGLSVSDLSSVIGGLQSTILLLGPLTKLYRNVRLELNDRESTAVDTTEYLFEAGSPIVVGTHRVNYVSGVSPVIAHSGRRKLENYLKIMTEDKHLIFLTSSELFQIYTSGHSCVQYGEEILVRNYTHGRVYIVKKNRKRYSAFDLERDHLIDPDGDHKDTKFLYVPPESTISFQPDSPR